MSAIEKNRVIDLHCDLLWYLSQSDGRSPWDPESNCSFQQLNAGGVAIQTLAIYVETGSCSVAEAEKQKTLFQTLPRDYPTNCAWWTQQEKRTHSPLSLLAAIENASALCTETESLSCCFSRLDSYQESKIPLLYISLTWNHENRFGGGNQTKTGLKPDGKALLEYLSGKGIAIDLSHTSDRLAYDILEAIDTQGWDLIPIASHSNFRSITHHPRNLPDTLAKEIIRRNGVIGLNFVHHFVGKDMERDLLRHISHAYTLGGENNLCLGADFFYASDLGFPLLPVFSPPYHNASCYPHFLQRIETHYGEGTGEKIIFRNAENFLKRQKVCC